jgi:ferrous iron transport protein B
MADPATAAHGGKAEPTSDVLVSASKGGVHASVVVVVGNPNVGKTSLFNRLTGQSARVGNYPGVTVERRSGSLKGSGGSAIQLIDVPGAYSLAARSAEEQLAVGSVLGLFGQAAPDLVVLVVDAGQLIRNLYLGLQLAELGVPLLIALNMVDEVADNPPHPEAVSKLFGVPVVATNARSGEGTDALAQAIVEALERPPRARVQVNYPARVQADRDRIADGLPVDWRGSVERNRGLALWALTSLEEDDELQDIPEALRASCEQLRQAHPERDLDHEVIASRYAFLDLHASSLYQKPTQAQQVQLLSERIDRVLLHPGWGFLVFALVMLLVFQALFTWSEPGIALVEDLIAWLQGVVASALPDTWLRSLVADGVVAGVGNVIVFLPQILLLFFFIGILEDSGYMARVAYLMDRVMRSLGLHGRAFVPMLSGFACAVPAILATRTMERRRDRLLTMLVVPLMTCSARLPVYSLIIAALFPRQLGWLPLQATLMVGMYLFALAMTLLSAFVLGRTVVKGKRVPLILELPPYRRPQLRMVWRMVRQRSGSFLREAGGVILVCTVVLWALLSFPRAPVAPEGDAISTVAAESAPEVEQAERAEVADAEASSLQLQQSYGGRLGKALEPLLLPLGFDWKIGVGLIGAFAAREVFISTMAIVYGLGEVDDEALPLRERLRKERRADGSPVYTPLVGLSLLVFFALACQCMSTLAVVRRETQSYRWPAFLFAYMTLLAYGASLLVYQGGRLLGFQ